MALPPHTVLQPPQWKRSFWRSTQPVPQMLRFGAQERTHRAPWQKAPSGQATPQPPQFRASEEVSVHVPPQSERGRLQLQAPAMHSSSASHAVPQAPQLSRSADTSMQRPLQNDWPPGHPWEHAPAWQTAPAWHARPQPPQFASSVWMSEQRPEHVVSPVAQPITPAWQRLSTQE
jgi:hypothetical protein